ncbi:putative repeat protein (TIGR01451 family) [Pseudoxanthomonas sp. 3HH-4]|uniref:prealbumin-like fold domain-containing protein n=1 Tax=Pseudoxanthomonas sp. 3HH-4 TaxID=1690214 RepID=UPI00116A51C0|nr:DUF11 domain-containing protein [Pseudoxanthomonas sp. 3HH-4]TQM05688.1 putative repeat protein (TIGR01451 family) [Pseudoxanthomonas sp. 3HH-4]
MSYHAIDGLRPSGAFSARPSSSTVALVTTKTRRWRRGTGQAGLLLAGLVAAGSALALITGTWTTNGSASATTTVNGITVTWTGMADSAYSNGSFNGTNGGRWTDPYGGTVNGGASLTLLHEVGSRNYTVTFSKPVDNPVLHIDRLGGAIGSDPNSSRWTLNSSVSQGGTVSLTRLSGNPQFLVNGSTFVRDTSNGFSGEADAECRTGNTGSIARGTACGSVRFNGTGITSLTFNAGLQGPTGGDQLEVRWSFEGSSVIVRKQSAGGTGTFGITASNALSQAFNLTTTAQNSPVASAIYPVTNHAAAITLTESSVPTGYVLTSGACTDQSGAAVSVIVDTATRQITIPTANYRANQTITCTLTNSAQATLALAKTWVNAAINDTAALSATGGATNATLSSTANSASETDTGSAVQVVPGNVITLGETLGAGNARTYTAGAWSCTGGSLSGNTLTLTSAHAGQAIICTIINTARVADLSVVKSTASGPSLSGALRNFTVTVSNAGPSAADGALVSDTPGGGLSCPAAGNPITCSASGGAACPGAAALPSLVSGGVAVPVLPAGGLVTFIVPCQVTATGL